MSTDLEPSPVRHPWVTWRAHAWWAALILLPFLVPHAAMALDDRGADAATTLVLYGPVIASVWIAGHLALAAHRRHRVLDPVLAHH